MSSRDPECRPDSILSANVLARLLNFIFLALLLPIRRYDPATVAHSDGKCTE